MSSNNTKSIVNAFTVDVEDFFQVEAFSGVIKPGEWDSFSCRVEANMDVVLSLLDNANVKGTFFVLGWIAKRYPNVVKKIVEMGHEIASHGMSHQLIYNQDINVFRQETIDSKSLLEDISQQAVNGYRAATYSITNKSLWALDVLVEAGFKYDSSIFPMRHDRYGISDACPLPNVLKTPNGSKIIEFPISTVKNNLFTMPIAGGGYFRLFPYAVTRWGLSTINRNKNPFVFYIHPWEIDPDQPVVDNIGRFTRFRHYNNLSRCGSRLKNLLDDFDFNTMQFVLDNTKLINS
jgi:polysaccharide deacetylase family protein (PEP-CTERM system associated)